MLPRFYSFQNFNRYRYKLCTYYYAQRLNILPPHSVTLLDY
nr:MAG TPA: hypothetical protein [Caudoviricetes sp.]